MTEWICFTAVIAFSLGYWLGYRSASRLACDGLQKIADDLRDSRERTEKELASPR